MSTPVPGDLKIVPRSTGKRNRPPLNAFSVDIEEWFQVGAFENTLKRSDWQTLESRVELQTNKILEILETCGVSATFFCLGWVAERYPGLVQSIARAGHEIGCHGMDHRRIFTLSAEEFAKDIARSKGLLEDASGEMVRGYRAPSFSMNTDTWSYYRLLEKAGFSYSSSVVPAKTDHYGMKGLPRVPFYPLEDSNFIEVPMTVAHVGGAVVPASGGGYFRLLPQFLSRFLMNRAKNQTGVGTIFYMHPWEIDPDQPFVRDAPLKSRLRHYTYQSQMAGKISSLLGSAQFSRMDHLLTSQFAVEF